MEKQELPVLLQQALQAYELAVLSLSKAQAEQKQSEQLLDSTRSTVELARVLVEKVGYAQVQAPSRLDETKADSESDKAIVQAFADAQLAYRDLRISLLALAKAYLDEQQWEKAGALTQPFLQNHSDALYAQAQSVLVEVYYQQAREAFEHKELGQASEGFKSVLKIRSPYKDAQDLLLRTYLDLAQSLQDRGDLQQTRQVLEQSLRSYRDSAELVAALCEVYYQSGVRFVEAKDWSAVQRELQLLWARDDRYKDTKDWMPRLVQEAIQGQKPDEAMTIFTTLASEEQKKERQDLLCEIQYQIGLAALEQRDWSKAKRQLERVWRFDPHYKDTENWMPRLVKGALEVGRPDEAMKLFRTFLLEEDNEMTLNRLGSTDATMLLRTLLLTKSHRKYNTLLCETYYQLGLQAIQAKDWLALDNAFGAICEMDPNYRNIIAWVQEYPVTLWTVGQIACVQEVDLSQLPVDFTAAIITIALYQDRFALMDVTKLQEKREEKPQSARTFGRLFDAGTDSQVRTWNQNCAIVLDLASRQVLWRKQYKQLDDPLLFISPSNANIQFLGYDKLYLNTVAGCFQVDFVSNTERKVNQIPNGLGWASRDERFQVKQRRWQSTIQELEIEDRKTGSTARFSHLGTCKNVAFSEDSKRLATMSSDGIVRIWEPQLG